MNEKCQVGTVVDIIEIPNTQLISYINQIKVTKLFDGNEKICEYNLVCDIYHFIVSNKF